MDLEFDIRRTIILSNYINAWNQPVSRRCISKEGKLVELYEFKSEMIHRYATVGLSSNSIGDSEKCNSELLLCCPKNVSKLQKEEIENYIFDVCAYMLEAFGRNARYQDLIPENQLAPNGWPKAVLFDEPRGEPEFLECFHVGVQHINLLWMVPIHGSEYDLIKKQGIEAFDSAIERIEWSLVEVNRESCAQYS